MKKRIRHYAIHIGRWTLHVGRWTGYVSAVVLVLLAIVFSVARLLLPSLVDRKDDLEEYLSHRSSHQVRIEQLSAYWDGLHPGLRVTGLQVYASEGLRPAIRLSEMRVSLALVPLLWGNFEINSLVVVNPSLALERLEDGRFRISGFNPLRASERADDEKFVGWLFRQNSLAIENGEMQWFDHKDSSASVHLSKVNLTLQNSGERHHLGFNADFPPEMCRSCSVVIDIEGNPFVSTEWDGEIFLRAVEVNVSALPLIARERLPSAVRGRFTAQLWSEWEHGQPTLIRGDTRVAGLRVPIKRWDAPLVIREASGDINWEVGRSGWRLDVAHPVLGLSGPVWQAGHLRISRQSGESAVQIKHIDLESVTRFIEVVRKEVEDDMEAAAGIVPNEFFDYWTISRPEGSVDNLSLRLVGDWMAPTDFSLEADLAGINLQAYRKFPGVHGMGAHVSMTRNAGHAKFDIFNAKISLPAVFRAPLPVRRMDGEIVWEKTADAWQVNGNNLHVVSDDVRGTGKLTVRVPTDRMLPPHVKLRVDFHDGKGEHAARYFPVHRLEASTLAWMERSFVSGEVTKGYLIYDGAIPDFPFRHQTGKFELRAHVRDAVYSYLPGWEPIKHAEVDVAVNGPEVLVTGNGKIAGLDANQVVVQVRESEGAGRVVQVTGKVAGPVNETLSVLRAAKSSVGTKWFTSLPSGLQGNGQGLLSLDLRIPLGLVAETSVAGEYRFLKADLSLPDTGVSMQSIEGKVQFTESGLREGNLHGQFLGGDIVAAAAPLPDGLQIYAQGTIHAQALTPILGPRVASRISGLAGWHGTWRWSKGIGTASLESDWRGLRLSLPPPLNFSDGLGEGKFIVKTESSSRDNHLLTLNAGRSVSGRLVFSRHDAGWNFSSGRIGLGDVQGSTSVPHRDVPMPRSSSDPQGRGEVEQCRSNCRDAQERLAGAPSAPSGEAQNAREANTARRKPGATEDRVPLPKEPGLHVSARLAAVALDDWLPLLGDGRRPLPDFLTRVSAEIRSLDLVSRRFESTSLDLSRTKDGWSGTVGGPSAAGHILFAGKAPATRIELDLAHLALPEKGIQQHKPASDPRRFPILTIRSKSFQVRNRQLGELDFAAAPDEQGWVIQRFNLTRPEMKLAVSGEWQMVNNKHRSDFAIDFNSSDMGKTMEAFGVADQMSGGDVHIKSRLAWPDMPANAQLALLNGKVEVDAKKGRFLQVKPGAGRLFGLLDLSAVGRYLMLDFSPLFGKGFIFDRIQGQIDVEKGNARTKDFLIKGPATEIGVGGRIGLAAEDFDLAIDIQPKLSGTLTLASWGLWGPQVAAVVLAVQKIFKQQITKGTHVTYVVKGPWDKPEITKSVKGDAEKAKLAPPPPVSE